MNLDVVLAEESITQAMIDDTLPHDRLRAAVRKLDQGAYAGALTDLRQALAAQAGRSTRDALIRVLDEIWVRQRLPIVDLQILAIGYYRLVWRLLARLDPQTTLDEIRQLDARQSADLCYGFTFGLHRRPFPIPASMIARTRRRLAEFLQVRDADQEWKEDGPLPLAVPLVALSDRHLSPSANAIRNTFFAQVFADTLATEAQPPPDDDALVLDVLLEAAADVHLLPSLRHVTLPQARFRLRQLTQALVALHQLEATGGPATARGIPYLEAVIGCLLSPFVSLRGWLRANRERLLIPVVRELPDDDVLIIQRPAITIPRPEPTWVPALH
ncbi:MAG TPA: hypothetical protein VHX44_15850 [Planctomycetota bacterium]|nr:hypothetical protein [Planctomycetota bacterium]